MIAPAMFTGDDVTWYVPCYNAHATLSRCLHGITQQCTRPARVLVIDDGSHDSYGTLPVEVIRHKSNAGLAAARNTALAACRTPLLAAVDADVAVEPDWLRRMLDTLNDTRAAGAGGCLREHYDDTPADSWRARHMAQHWGQAPLRNPRFLFGSNTLFVADALRAIGGYDTRWRTNGEDIAVSEAVYATGRALAYAPDAVGRHLRQDTIRTVLRGFWQWHHVAGVRNRDFDTLETLVDRIERVGIGIWRFRAARDEREGCTDLLPLDAALPWIFAACDLAFAAHHARGLRIELDLGQFGGLLPFEAQQALHAILPGRIGDADDALSAVYTDAFEQALHDSGWFDHTHHLAALSEMLEDERIYGARGRSTT